MDQVKLQKSQLWIISTLWVSMIFFPGLIFFILKILLVLSIPLVNPYVLTILLQLALLFSFWLAAYNVVNYLLKKSVIFRSEATKMGFLAICIPVAWNIFKIVFQLQGSGLSQAYVVDLGITIVTLAIVFFSVRHLILTKGD